MTTHTPDEALLFYRFGTLEGLAKTTCAEHLRTCQQCAARYATLGQGLEQLAAWDLDEPELDAELDAAREQALVALEARNTAKANPAPVPMPVPTPAPAEPPKSWRWWLGLDSTASHRPWRLAAATLAAMSAMWVSGGALYFSHAPAPGAVVSLDQELAVEGHSLLRVDARGHRVPVKVSLKTSTSVVPLFEGHTDALGHLDLPFTVPYVADDTAEVMTQVDGEPLSSQVRLTHAHRVHVGLDKPVYQPGQTIHLRALVLRDPSLLPALGQPVTLSLKDPTGHVVAHRELNASRFGVVSADFELGSEAALGHWAASASVAGVERVLDVEVARYTLPRFKLEWSSGDKKAWLAGEDFKAQVMARTFYGKPVVGAKVQGLLLLTKHSERWETRDIVADMKGVTDGDGHVTLVGTVPQHLAAEGPETLTLVLEATDSAGQQVHAEHPVRVARSMLAVTLYGDELTKDVEGSIFIVTTGVDGGPISAKVSLHAVSLGTDFEVQTSNDGLGVLRVRPTEFGRFELVGRAVDSRGHATPVATHFEVMQQHFSFTTDRALYRPGDTIEVRLSDRNEQPISGYTRSGNLLLSATAQNGSASVPLPNGFRGTLTLSSETFRREVLVVPDDELSVSFHSDASTYRPGQEAKLRFSVRDAQGKPRVAALGINIVDEALSGLRHDSPDSARASLLFDLPPNPAIPALSAVLGHEARDEQTQHAARLALLLDDSASRPVDRVVDDSGPQAAQAFTAHRFQWVRSLYALSTLLAVVLLVLLLRNTERLASFAVGLTILLLGLKFPGPGVLGWFVAGTLLVWQALRKRPDVRWTFFTLPLTALATLLTLAFIPVPPSFQRLTPPAMTSPAATSEPLPVVPGSYRNLGGANRTSALEAKRKQPTRHDDDFDNRYGGAAKGPRKNDAPGPGCGNCGAPIRDPALTDSPPPEPPRRLVHVRERFPETLYVHPELIADESGEAQLTVRMADTVTDWRVRALASSGDGKLGTLDAPLKVFQPFFVELDAPVALVVGDEATIPLTVQSYLDAPQDVRLEVQVEPWFDLLGPAKQTVSLRANAMEAGKLRVRVKQPGRHALRVRADGTSQSDVVEHSVLVTEEGQPASTSVAGQLSANAPKRIALHVPPGATGPVRLSLRLAPTLVAAALDGIEGTLRQPTGCFEQTSAKTWPNALILQLFSGGTRLSPELQATFRGYLQQGAQRLGTFEVRGGGFEWFGRSPASPVLTAFGVMELTDVALQAQVDPGLRERALKLLMAQQARDGAWSERPGDPDVKRAKTTAYVAWALSESDSTSPAIQRAQAFLSRVLPGIRDPYTLALIAAGFANQRRPELATLLPRLVKEAQPFGTSLLFHPAEPTLFSGYGNSGDVETTALVAYALTKAGVSEDVAKRALDYILSQRAPHGGWVSTQATVLSLKALLVSHARAPTTAVTVAVNGETPTKLSLANERVRVFEAALHHGENVIEVTGDGDAPFIATAEYTLPWPSRGDTGPLKLKVDYDARDLEVGDILPVNAQVSWQGNTPSGMAMVSLGIPPGVAPIPEDLEALRLSGLIARSEVTEGALSLYLDRLTAAATTLKVRFKAQRSVTTQGAGSLAYLYYDPEVRAVARPIAITVR